MFSVTELVSLSPDDKPAIFYQKLPYLSENNIENEIQRFEKYAKYAAILKFHLAVQRRPELNIRVTYNDRDFHISSCLNSLSNAADKVIEEECNCAENFEKPLQFLFSIETNLLFRCHLCKRYFPDSEAFVCDKSHEEHTEEMLSDK